MGSQKNIKRGNIGEEKETQLENRCKQKVFINKRKHMNSDSEQALE